MDTNVCLGKPHSIILHDDAEHSQMAIVHQIRKAMHCCSAEAFYLAISVKEDGKAVIWSGGLERCEHIASIFEEINLGVSIIPTSELNSED